MAQPAVRSRHTVLLTAVVAAGVAAGVLPFEAPAAAAYPQRAIRLIIPYPPGGAGDIIGRILAARLGEAMGQQVVADNRPGGG